MQWKMFLKRRYIYLIFPIKLRRGGWGWWFIFCLQLKNIKCKFFSLKSKPANPHYCIWEICFETQQYFTFFTNLPNETVKTCTTALGELQKNSLCTGPQAAESSSLYFGYNTVSATYRNASLIRIYFWRCVFFNGAYFSSILSLFEP